MVGNWTFCPFVSSPPSLIQRFLLRLLIFLLIQLKPTDHRLDVVTIFLRGVRGMRGAMFRDTLSFVVHQRTPIASYSNTVRPQIACLVRGVSGSFLNPPPLLIVLVLALRASSISPSSLSLSVTFNSMNPLGSLLANHRVTSGHFCIA